MIDWTSSMQQTFEYYIVDPGTWKDIKRVDTVISSTINRDIEAETLGSAAINISESLDECYIRIYLIAFQNGREEKVPLGTYLIQTPSYSFDGKTKNITMDGYTPLLELKEKEQKDPLEVFEAALENIMPVLEVKARRIGGATYQVPLEIRAERRQTLGLRWLVTYARNRHEKTMAEKLAGEIIDAINGNGGAFKKKEDTHKMAEANKAFAHYKW